MRGLSSFAAPLPATLFDPGSSIGPSASRFSLVILPALRSPARTGTERTDLPPLDGAEREVMRSNSSRTAGAAKRFDAAAPHLAGIVLVR